MGNQILRDNHGHKIGEIQTRPDGKQTLRDGFGRHLGDYDARNNITRDTFGRRVGDGNLLSSLIHLDHE